MLDYKRMYKDTIKNLTDNFSILDVRYLTPKSITTKGVAGVAQIGVFYEVDSTNPSDIAVIQPEINLGFDPNIFSDEISLENFIKTNYDKGWLAAKNDNVIIVHEVAHMIDYQLSIKKNGKMSLKEFLQPKIVNVNDAPSEMNKLIGYIERTPFSEGFAEELRRELDIPANQLIKMVSDYSQDNEQEFFAEAFTKWYLSTDKKGKFEKTFNKVFKERMSKI